MRRLWVICISLLAFAVTMLAQGQIATVTSSSSFQLGGATVTPGQGVPSWPITSGDTIKAGSSPVTITFPDGSTITLTPGSQATLTLQGTMPVFNLQSGTAQYDLKTTSSVRLEALSSAVTPKTPAGRTEPAGSYSIRGNKVVAGFWTAGHTAAVLGGAGAAAGLGVGLANATGGAAPAVSQ